MSVGTKSKIFTWIYRTFMYFVPCGIALWQFLIETLIKNDVTIMQKIGISGVFIIAIIFVIAVFFYGKHLRKKEKSIDDKLLVCIDNEKKKELIKEKHKWQFRQEMFRNICFMAPFIIAWIVMSAVEKKVVSLRGTLMIVSISMAIGLGFNGVAQWLKGKNNEDKK